MGRGEPSFRPFNSRTPARPFFSVLVVGRKLSAGAKRNTSVSSRIDETAARKRPYSQIQGAESGYASRKIALSSERQNCIKRSYPLCRRANSIPARVTQSCGPSRPTPKVEKNPLVGRMMLLATSWRRRQLGAGNAHRVTSLASVPRCCVRNPCQKYSVEVIGRSGHTVPLVGRRNRRDALLAYWRTRIGALPWLGWRNQHRRDDQGSRWNLPRRHHVVRGQEDETKPERCQSLSLESVASVDGSLRPASRTATATGTNFP